MKKCTICIFILFLSHLCEAQNFKYGKVSEAEVREEKHPLEPEANAAVLYRSVNTYYEFISNSGLNLVTTVHERIKIYNKDGFDWATREIRAYKDSKNREKISGLKGTTFNWENGKLQKENLKNEGIFEEELNQYQWSQKFTMPAVTQGSVIEFEYSLRSPFITSIDDILLQYTIPINYIEASISVPEFLGFKKHYNPRSSLLFKTTESKKTFSHTMGYVERNRESPVTSSAMGTSKISYEQNIHSLSQENIPSLKEENYIDHLANYGAFIKWELAYTRFPNSPIENFAESWEGVSKKIYSTGGYETELSKTSYFEEDIDELLQGVTDQALKTSKIFAFVKSKVKWNNFIGFHALKGGRKAYKEGEGNVGDINLLLTAMLRYAGLNAHPVLVSTKDNGVPLFPTQKGFNYVIAAVEIDGKHLLLDATEVNAGIGELPARARNWNGRILKNKEISDWVSLMPEKQSVNKVTLNLQFDKEMRVQGKCITLRDGLYAKSFRDNYKGLSPDSYLQILEKNKGNIHISEVKTENTELVGEEIKQSYSFDLADGVESIGDKIYLRPLLFMAEKENPFKADTGSYPIIFDHPSLEERIVNILVPEGFEVEFLPESSILELNNGAGTFRFITGRSGNYLRVRSALEMNHTVFTPEHYEYLKQFYEKLVETHTEAIVLKRI